MLGQDGWILALSFNIGICMDLNFFLVHKNAKK